MSTEKPFAGVLYGHIAPSWAWCEVVQEQGWEVEDLRKEMRRVTTTKVVIIQPGELGSGIETTVSALPEHRRWEYRTVSWPALVVKKAPGGYRGAFFSVHAVT
ncbi:MAG: hypothetical protein GTO24_26205 [candidate division Zixibacteria bacterium]|nr:hypothetical protein [candidate division Zixibacteria bacterium]